MRRWVIAGFLLGIGGVLTVEARAAIVTFGAAPGTNNNVACATERWTWGMVGGAVELGNSRCRFWHLDPNSPAGPAPGQDPLKAGEKDLLFELQHNAAPHAGEANPNPANLITFYFGRLSNAAQPAGQKKAGVLVQPHNADRDVYHARVEVPPAGAPATIFARAQHMPGQFRPGRALPNWSYDPADDGGPAKLEVFATYPTDPPKRAEGISPGKITTKKDGRLPAGRSGEAPTDYHIRATLGDPYFSDMTLAFIAGGPGNHELAELALMNEFFTGGDEYLVPMIFDINGLIDLYIAVDLTQWLSFPILFGEGDIFEISNGVNDMLAGMQFATSPFTFDPTVGFVSPDLWDGTGIVFGTVDGGNTDVPEPSGIAILLAGLGALALVHRRWIRKPATGW